MRKRSTAKGETFYSNRELILMVFLIAGLDPDRYPHPRAKSLIYKCKADREKIEQ